jgi:uncharacterized damage-inducible protein DinB
MSTTSTVISPDDLLKHWQGHRSLTRRVIEAFPDDDKLFNYSIGGMRPFAQMAIELLGMGVPSLNGVINRSWEKMEDIAIYKKENQPTTKQALLEIWDKNTEDINNLWPKIDISRFQDIEVAFGMWEGPVYWLFFYNIDNEIHHRGQGYVYLRSLGIEPPPFWER